MNKTAKLSVIIIMVLAAGILGLSYLFKSNNENIEALETFARLYGYVRYFHPSDEAAQIDWDHLAYYGVKKVRQAKNRKQLAKTLTELFHPIAPTITIYNSEDKNEFQEQHITPPDTSGMKVITHQHYGVDLGYSSHIYRSIRLNRKNTINLASWFFFLHQKMPAGPCKGKEFILKVAIKVERGNPHLFFYEKGPKIEDPDNGFMENRLISPGQLQYYEIKNKVSPDAETIGFGFYLNKIGKVQVDDFQLVVKEGDKWIPVPIPDAGFEAGPGKMKAWKTIGSGWDKKIINHAEAKGKYCFSVENIIEDVPTPLFPQHPQPGEHINEDIGSGLSCIVPLALYGTDTSTYPKAPADKTSKLQAALKEAVPAEFSMEDRNLRFADVIITWNVIQHFYPYFDVVNTDWNKMLTFGLKHTLDDENEQELANTLKMMLAQLKDGHASVRHKALDDFQLPIACDWIENQLVVTVSNDGEIDKGDVVRAIDGTDSKIVLAEAEKLCSGSPQYVRKKAMRELLSGPQNSDVSIEIVRDGKVMEIDSKRKRTIMQPMREFRRKKIEDLGEGLYYVDLNAISEKDFKDALEKLKTAEGIVFDGRHYIPYDLKMVLGYLVDKPIQSPIFGVPEVIYPNRKKTVINDERWDVEPTQPRLTAPCVFLTNGEAVSASETFLSMVKYYKLGEIIGQPTAGVNGDINSVVLPGYFTVTFTGARTLNHDGSPFHTIGVLPTIPCKRTIQGVKEGRDELLEKAVEILKMQVKKI